MFLTIEYIPKLEEVVKSSFNVKKNKNKII
jgi:hypothetical protein